MNRVDKQKQQISIKINGKERTIKPNEPVEIEEYQKIYTTDSFHLKEVAAAQEEEEFTWVLPEEQENTNEDISYIPIEDLRKPSKSKINGLPPTPFNRKSNMGMKHSILSTILAIIIGTGFGMIILNVIANLDAKEETPAISQPKGTQPTTPADKPKGAEESIALELPSLELGVIQEGMYTTNDSAITIVEKMKKSGFAAAVLEEDGLKVFTGIGFNKVGLGEIEKLYEAAGIDKWAKPFLIEGGSFSNVNKEEAEYVVNGQALLLLLSEQSSTAFQTGIISDDKWNKIFELYGNVKDQKLESASEEFKSFSTNLKNAYESLKKYKGTSDKKDLWNTQQALLDALQNYQNWKKGLS